MKKVTLFLEEDNMGKSASAGAPTIGAVGCDAMAAAMHGLFLHAERIGVDPMRFDDLIEVVRRRWVEETAKRLGVSMRELDREGTAMLAVKYREEFRLLMERIVAAESYWRKKSSVSKIVQAVLLGGGMLIFAAGIITLIYFLVIEQHLISEEIVRRMLAPHFPEL